MSLPAYSLHCSVCQVEFFTQIEWSKHLSRDEHQNLTRKECLLECKDSWRECSIVILSSQPFTRELADEVIEYFANQTTFVTDFVWWEDRPRIGIIQFESRTIVKNLLVSVKSSKRELVILNQRFQLKGSYKLLDLEWSAILPEENGISATQRAGGAIEEEDSGNGGISSDDQRYTGLEDDIKVEGRGSEQQNNDIVPNPEEDEDAECEVNDQQQLQSASQECDSQLYSASDGVELTEVDNPVARLREIAIQREWELPVFTLRKLKDPNLPKYTYKVHLNGVRYKPSKSRWAADTKKQAKANAAHHCLKTLNDSFYPESNDDYSQNGQNAHTTLLPKVEHDQHDGDAQYAPSLHDQFEPIRDLVQIPDTEYQKASKVVKQFGCQLSRSNLSVQTVIFRNWYMKLWNAVSDKLLVYVYSATPPPSLSPIATDPLRNFTWIPGGVIMNKIFNGDGKHAFTCEDRAFPKVNVITETELGYKFTHIKTGLNFHVLNHRKLIVEAQMCCLVQYMCTFNPLVCHLFTLVNYWAIVNNVKIGEEDVASSRVHQHLPDPCTLEWLVITFLTHEKHLPSARKILERPHKQLIQQVIDIGFHADSKYALEWSQKYLKRTKTKIHCRDLLIVDVLQLFQDFLVFCKQTIIKGGVILNTRDGEILDKTQFIDDPNSVCSMLTREERASIAQMQKDDSSGNKMSEPAQEDENEGPRVDFSLWKWYMIHPLIVHWRFSISRNNSEHAFEIMQRTSTNLQQFLDCLSSDDETRNAFEEFGALEEIFKVGVIPVVNGSNDDSSRKRKHASDNQSDDQESDIQLGTKRFKTQCPSNSDVVSQTPGDGTTTTTTTSHQIGNLPIKVMNDANFLSYQFWSIRKAVTIPDAEYKKHIKVVKSLQKMFHLADPTAEVIMFRHWHLKLQSSKTSSELLVYVNSASATQPDFPNTYTWLHDTNVSQIFRRSNARRYFRVVEEPQVPLVIDIDSNEKQRGWRVMHKPTGVITCVVTFGRFMAEAQVSRLLEFMCQFDPRCHPLLTLALFWADANSVSFGKKELNFETSHLRLPEPHTLYWLVMHFLCHEKIIPTPREIQQRPHQTVKERLTGTDIGFHVDPKFVEEWIATRQHAPPIPINGVGDTSSSEEFVDSVLDLFLEFLQFCGTTLEGGNFILNTRDGEVIPTEIFSTCSSGGEEDKVSWTTNMSKDNDDDESPQQRVRFKEWKLYMSHPLIFHWKFSVSEDIQFVFKLMSRTAIQLRMFHHQRRRKQFSNLQNFLIVNKITRIRL